MVLSGNAARKGSSFPMPFCMITTVVWGVTTEASPFGTDSAPSALWANTMKSNGPEADASSIVWATETQSVKMSKSRKKLNNTSVWAKDHIAVYFAPQINTLITCKQVSLAYRRNPKVMRISRLQRWEGNSRFLSEPCNSIAPQRWFSQIPCGSKYSYIDIRPCIEVLNIHFAERYEWVECMNLRA